MAQDRETLYALVAANLPTQSTNNITAAKVREVINSVIESSVNEVEGVDLPTITTDKLDLTGVDRQTRLNELTLAAAATNGDVLTITNGNATFVPSVGGSTLPAGYQDVRVEWVDASTVKIKAGSRCRSSDDTTDIVFAADQTIDLSTAGAGGLDAGTVAGSTHYHIYAISDGSTVSAVASAGSVTLPSGYTKFAKLRAVVTTDAASNIIPFVLSDGELVYTCNVRDGGVADTAVLVSGSATTYTEIDISAFVPPEAIWVGVYADHSYTNSYLRTKGLGNEQPRFSSYSGYTSVYRKLGLRDQDKILEYKVNGSSTCDITVAGYKLGEML